MPTTRSRSRGKKDPKEDPSFEEFKDELKDKLNEILDEIYDELNEHKRAFKEIYDELDDIERNHNNLFKWAKQHSQVHSSVWRAAEGEEWKEPTVLEEVRGFYSLLFAFASGIPRFIILSALTVGPFLALVVGFLAAAAHYYDL